MSREAFDTAIEFILPHETEFMHGHYGDWDYVLTENVPGDSGGKTRYGIDQSSHPNVNIDGLSKEDAIEIYYDEWNQHNLDALPAPLAIIAFDVWVNGGHADLWLQQAYNIAHPDRPPLKADGKLGTLSLAALNDCDEKQVALEFLNLRQARFDRLANQPSLAKFLAGWTQRNSDLRQLIA